MSKITAFTPVNLGEIREAMTEAMAKIEAEFGIKIKIGKMVYTAESLKVPVEAMVGADDPMMKGVDPKWVSELTKYRDTKDLFKKTIEGRGFKGTIVGMKPRTSGTQVVVRDAASSGLKLVPIDKVRAYLVE